VAAVAAAFKTMTAGALNKPLNGFASDALAAHVVNPAPAFDGDIVAYGRVSGSGLQAVQFRASKF
jgi:hypothetical protein